MSLPYVGEIRLFAGNFAPKGWEFCHGQVLPIEGNEVLFQLIGTTYGGNGTNTFALPDLQGRIPLHYGQGSGLSNRQAGEVSGLESVTLTTDQLPAHRHALLASTDGGVSASPAGKVLASSPNVTTYVAEDATAPLPATTVADVGGGQPHENMMPTIAIHYIISMFGIFPTQN